MTKYDRPSEFLKCRSDNEGTLSFDEIERLLKSTRSKVRSDGVGVTRWISIKAPARFGLS
jgi:hypothetical protein